MSKNIMSKRPVPYPAYKKRGEIIDRLQKENDRLQTENKCLHHARDRMEWIRTDIAYKAPEQVTVELMTFYITDLEGALERKKDNPG